MIAVMAGAFRPADNGRMAHDADVLHVAGVLVRVTTPARCAALAAMPGVEIHAADAGGQRVVVTLESTSADGLRQLHESVARLPGVVGADLVCHLTDHAG